MPLLYVAATVAFAFGLAAASFFPILVLGIFSKRVTREGAIAGMVTGIVFMDPAIDAIAPTAREFDAEQPEGVFMVGFIPLFVGLAMLLYATLLAPSTDESNSGSSGN